MKVQCGKDGNEKSQLNEAVNAAAVGTSRRSSHAESR
jgi:hypothetical protein